MKLIIECLIIGTISAICYTLSYKITNINNDDDIYNLKSYIRYLNNINIRNNIILCFIMGALIHYIIKKSNLTSLYCKKVCYDDVCLIVCPYN
jgi:hypothetical protein